MKIHGTSKTKDSKYNATVGLIVSIGMLIFAFIGFDFSTMPAFGKAFMVLWIFVVCAQGYQCYRNSIFSNKDLHHEETKHNLKVSGSSLNQPTPITTKKNHAQQLREIEQLYREGLLTSDEYNAKRADVLDEDWGK